MKLLIWHFFFKRITGYFNVLLISLQSTLKTQFLLITPDLAQCVATGKVRDDVGWAGHWLCELNWPPLASELRLLRARGGAGEGGDLNPGCNNTSTAVNIPEPNCQQPNQPDGERTTDLQPAVCVSTACSIEVRISKECLSREWKTVFKMRDGFDVVMVSDNRNVKVRLRQCYLVKCILSSASCLPGLDRVIGNIPPN